jgi:hypothetical protein
MTDSDSQPLELQATGSLDVLEPIKIKINKHIQEMEMQLKNMILQKSKVDKLYEMRSNKILSTLELLSTYIDNDLKNLYRMDLIHPPMDTNEQIREAFWNYYPDEYVKGFGSSAVSEYYQYDQLYPDEFDVLNPNVYEWTREDVKKFVEGVPINILISIGW